MLVNRAKMLYREPIARPVRIGKTAKDKATGAWYNRFANREARAEKMKERK